MVAAAVWFVASFVVFHVWFRLAPRRVRVWSLSLWRDVYGAEAANVLARVHGWRERI